MTLLRSALPDPQPIEVSVVSSPAFDGVVACWAAVVEAEELDSFEASEAIRSLVALDDPDPDQAWMAAQHAQRWSFLVPHIADSGASSLGDLADYLSALEPDMLQRSLDAHGVDECDGSCDGPHLEMGDPADDQTRLVRILRRAHDGMAGGLSELAPMLDHDADLTRFLSRRMPLDQLVETVTNGIAYRPEPGIRKVVLVPSVLIRPWNLMFGFGDTQYFVYPVSDEAASADPDTPPSWMVQMFKALGDERRLRLLRRLAEGPAGLAELAECLDLAKSTTHHHLRTLRAAGLVRTVMQGDHKDEMRYELRADLFPEAVSFVSQYLEGG